MSNKSFADSGSSRIRQTHFNIEAGADQSDNGIDETFVLLIAELLVARSASVLFLVATWFDGWAFVPPMEAREVAGIPGFAESGNAQVPVRTNFASHDTQVVPKIDDRRTPPEPVAVVNAMDHQAWLQDERMRDHRVMFGIGVLLDAEIPLDLSPGV